MAAATDPCDSGGTLRAWVRPDLAVLAAGAHLPKAAKVLVQWDRWMRLLGATVADPAVRPLNICRLCVDTLGVSGAGISVVTREGERAVVCATDERSAQVEDLQLTLGEGPCIDAIKNGSPVLIPDLERPNGVAVERWPAFMGAAASAGVRAVFAFPLSVGAIHLGAIDLYRTDPGDLAPEELRGALTAADVGALAVLHLDIHGDEAFLDDEHERSAYQLNVHQATGIVMAQVAVSAEEAFLLLRARAFSLGRSLGAVADDVITHHLRFTPEDQ